MNFQNQMTNLIFKKLINQQLNNEKKTNSTNSDSNVFEMSTEFQGVNPEIIAEIFQGTLNLTDVK